MNSHNPMNIAADFAKATGGTARKVVALTDKGPLNGFKKFLSRGSMIDMAVGVVMGSAVTAVVNSIVDNLISPLIGMIGGVPDLSGLLTITFNNSTVSFGAILNALINFLLVGVAVYFCVILPINKLRDLTAAQDEADAEERGPSVEEQTLATLQEIRDELKRPITPPSNLLNVRCDRFTWFARNNGLPGPFGLDNPLFRACFVASVELHGEYD